MKNLKITSAFVLAAAVFSATGANANTVVASSLQLTAYQVWLSTNTNCTSPIKVIDNGTSGKSVDVSLSIDFGEGTLPADGSYKCLMIVLSDTKKLIPSVTGTTLSGGTQNNLCIAGTIYTQDACATGSSSVLPDGTTTTCTTGVPDKVAAYMSTTGTAGADGGSAATAKLLNAPIVIAGAAVTKTVYVSDPDGLVNQNGSCGQDSNAVLGIR